MSYAEPADLTDLVREVLKDKKPIAEKSVENTDETTPKKNVDTKTKPTTKDATPEDTPEDLKKRSKI